MPRSPIRFAIEPQKDEFAGQPEEMGTYFVRCAPEEATTWAVFQLPDDPRDGDAEFVEDCDSYESAVLYIQSIEGELVANDDAR